MLSIIILVLTETVTALLESAKHFFMFDINCYLYINYIHGQFQCGRSLHFCFKNDLESSVLCLL
jgi:hypothetical protein